MKIKLKNKCLDSISVIDNEKLLSDILEVKTLSKEEFFESSNYEIYDCYIYKIGNLINIQRLTCKQINSSSFDDALIIATIKNKYRPISDTYVRFMYQDDNNIGGTVPTRAFIYPDGKLRITVVSGSLTGLYLYNAFYICKGE